MKGLGGPGAPHYYKFQRRGDAGSFLVGSMSVFYKTGKEHTQSGCENFAWRGLNSSEIEASPWDYPEHPGDVIMRTLVGCCYFDS